jgi:elongation factor Ts
MEITAAMVKELRERTGAGMMECKKALVESSGNIEAAIESMRKLGQVKAAKKAGRIAAEGLIVIQQEGNYAAMAEVNCETDFVAKGDDFKNFCKAVIAIILRDQPVNLDQLLTTPFEGQKTVEQARQDLIAKLGENINIRRFTVMETKDGIYLHGTRIGVLVKLQNANADLAKDIAMHIAASRPLCVSPDQVPAELVAKEKEIYAAQAAESGKPANIIDKMVEGRVKKFLSEVSLLGQPFVKDPDQTIEKLLKSKQANVIAFERYEVGEGIEKKTTNFAEEVMQQVQGK